MMPYSWQEESKLSLKLTKVPVAKIPNTNI